MQLVISKGPAPRVVPNIIGLSVAEVAASVSTSQRSVERWLRMWGSTKGTTVVRLGTGRPVRYRVATVEARATA